MLGTKEFCFVDFMNFDSAIHGPIYPLPRLSAWTNVLKNIAGLAKSCTLAVNIRGNVICW